MTDDLPVRDSRSATRSRIVSMTGGGREVCRSARLNDLEVAAGWEGVLRANGIESIDAMFEVSGGESLNKPGLSPWRERIALALNMDGTLGAPGIGVTGGRGPQITVYLKRFTSPPREVVRAVRTSGTGASTLAGVEWVWLNRLAGEGIACPRPIALAEELSGTRERRSALLIERVPGRSLERWVGDSGDTDRVPIPRLIRATADLVADLHNRGYVHRDLYLSHLFFDPDAPPGSCLHLIDLARVLRPQQRRVRWFVKDIASLSCSAPKHLVSRTDRLRWLKRYLGVSKLDRSGRRLVYRIIGKTARIARHERRRQARFRSRSDPR